MDNRTTDDAAAIEAQRQHWEQTFANKPDMFGPGPSDAAKAAAEVFAQEGVRALLELGGGQGRDTIFFAGEGFDVSVLDYSEEAVQSISDRADSLGLAPRVAALPHDVRVPLPFADGQFDACFSHMLMCMALTTSELELVSSEVRRVLRPGGLYVYTVRNTDDAHYGTGTHRGEDMYEVGGFVVHFFRKEKVEKLARGFDILGIDEFEEGELPRKLFRVTLRKMKDA